MKLLIFDTETTGLLPKNTKLTAENINLFPYIVQCSYIIFNTKTNKIEKTFNQIVKPPITIPEEASNIHKITDEIAKENDLGIERVLDNFIEDFYQCNELVAHNMEFDVILIEAECIRLLMTLNPASRKRKYIQDFLNNYSKINKYCTMQNTTSFCQLKQKNSNYPKYPKLTELFGKLFPYKLDEDKMHDAYYDVVICLCCYMMFRSNINIMDKNKNIDRDVRFLIIN
jgi:DNA polymerase III epsilon subunit-like protein